MILDYSHCIAEAGLKFNKANKYKCPLKIKEWSNLRHLLLLQLAGPGPRQLAGPTGGDGIGSLHLPGSGDCTGNRIRNVIFMYIYILNYERLCPSVCVCVCVTSCHDCHVT